jgi:hypothetical protein
MKIDANVYHLTSIEEGIGKSPSTEKAERLYTAEEIERMFRTFAWEIFNSLEKEGIFPSPKGNFGKKNPIKIEEKYTSQELAGILRQTIRYWAYQAEVGFRAVNRVTKERDKLAQKDLFKA